MRTAESRSERRPTWRRRSWRCGLRRSARRDDDASASCCSSRLRRAWSLLRSPSPRRRVEEAAPTTRSACWAAPRTSSTCEHVPKTQTMPEEDRTTSSSGGLRRLSSSCSRTATPSCVPGSRKLLPFRNPIEIETGKFFVLKRRPALRRRDGRTASSNEIQKANARTRCIFENGTESNLLLQSLASNLYKDGKRVTEPSERRRSTRDGSGGGDQDGPHLRAPLAQRRPATRRVRDAPQDRVHSTTVDERIARAESDTHVPRSAGRDSRGVPGPRGAERKVEPSLHRLFAPAVDAWFERHAKRRRGPRVVRCPAPGDRRGDRL